MRARACIRRLGAGAGLFFWAFGCGGGTDPVAGTLKARLSTAYGDDGAVLVTVSGGPVDSIEAAGQRVYISRVDAGTVRFIVAGNLTAGIIALIHVPDARQASSYTAAISQVAARASYLQRNPALYAVTLTP